MNKMLMIALTGALLAGCTSKLESEFMGGCRSTGGSDSSCSCIYKKLEVPLKAADKNPNLLLSTEFKSAYTKAIQACIP
jgi:hypothetical protein